ncbi:hypothetical protein [Georgenia yuyongxinii]|uniref:Uncharacterized protein n=1 Tax=Georgenia yuyongxinii TaxID=2589797 RepID=A0A552WVT8_9MICO|nr:hypothetical protein [Georgenia yuyongxinii]TRW46413.1 hypothetical protein FJ693_05660 [Georgenia yuyongxinii]
MSGDDAAAAAWAKALEILDEEIHLQEALGGKGNTSDHGSHTVASALSRVRARLSRASESPPTATESVEEMATYRLEVNSHIAGPDLTARLGTILLGRPVTADDVEAMGMEGVDESWGAPPEVYANVTDDAWRTFEDWSIVCFSAKGRPVGIGATLADTLAAMMSGAEGGSPFDLYEIPDDDDLTTLYQYHPDFGMHTSRRFGVTTPVLTRDDITEAIETSTPETLADKLLDVLGTDHEGDLNVWPSALMRDDNGEPVPGRWRTLRQIVRENG